MRGEIRAYLMRLLFISIFFLVTYAQAQRLRDSLLFSDPIALSLAINSQYEESMPVFSIDSSQLYFVRTYHPDNIGGKNGDQDIWMSQRLSDFEWSTAVNIEDLNNKENNGAFGINNEGTKIYLLNAYLKKRNTFEKGVAVANNKGEGWEHNPETLPIPNLNINGDYYGFHVNHEETIIIISNMGASTLGQEDLYAVLKDSAGNWGSPIHLGPKVNSKGFEMSPFLSPNTDTLYFSSDGHGGFGEADIFYSVREDHTWQKWSEPKNLGPKINSDKFDAYFIRSENKCYWSSNRNGGLSDIYTADVTGMVWPPVYKEMVFDTLSIDPKPGSTVLIRPGNIDQPSINDRGDTMIVYVPNDTLFLLNIPNGGEQKQEVNLDNLEEIIFFDLDKYNLTFESRMSLDRVVAWLEENPSLYVRLEGHCDMRASREYNMWLSEQRVESAKKYLIDHGIDAARLNGGYYGKEELAIETSSVQDSEDKHHKNRRVTIQFGSYDEVTEIAETHKMPDIQKSKNYSGIRDSQTQNPAQDTNQGSVSETGGSDPIKVSEAGEGVEYKVQILTSGKVLDEDFKQLKNAEDVAYYKHNGLYKYTSGTFKDYKAAIEHMNSMRNIGYDGCFVVKFVDGKRASH